ncbi:Eco57I restriction-modification methylase domain-containing protein [Streptomyces sp. KL116D]|uniref:Eco57I restriction-modification methylase domain-containing protein n=1 Tax=Streptomyces sp. KL116D TaxID=3045152 RepID=UPI0035568C55
MSAATRTAPVFTAVSTVGGLLPGDMLVRIAEARNLPGTKPADYGLPKSVAVRDEAERAWEYLKPLWRDLRSALPADPTTGAPAADPTGRASSDWLTQLFRKLDFGTLNEVGPDGIPADSDTQTRFRISHRHGPALVHLIPWNQEPDKRPTAGQVPPQSLVQDCLNRTEAHLWAVLTNGRTLRLLRDSSSFATSAYVEFDLESIFDGELFSEFVLLYCVLHASRFEVAEGTAAAGCWLEKWRGEAVTSGARALDQLRLGVQQALTVLGTGFLRHPDNGRLREDTDPKALQAALLRLVYRLLFVFVAEDRDALLDPAADERARDAYARYFSSDRLRRRARRRQGTAHGDQYEALRLVLDALGTEGGRPELGLPGLGGLFSHTEADAPLDGLKLSNEALLTAVRHLAQVRDPGARRWRPVDYRHLDAEELGSVYESLLELEPKHSATDRSFELVEVAGNSRKTTGSYYTPSSLIECLLDTTLDPVIDDAVKRGEQRASADGRPDPADDIVDELLSLTVCDPACGSGHFLVASARRIAKRVAAVREHNPEPTLDAVRHALREVVARCIYGVDLNPMAVELAKVSLWLEAMEPGKALGFLDAHVRHGNGLIGATPKLLADGVPDEAFKPIEGDDKKYAAGLVKRNKAQRGGQDELLFDTEPLPGNDAYAVALRRIVSARAESLEDVHEQERAYRAYVETSAYVQDLHAADAWCAAFVWPKQVGAPEAPTDQVFRALRGRDQAGVPDATHAEILRLKEQYRFFHWHLEFPEVFAVPEGGAGVQAGTGWAGGFDAVVGNPPWERIDFDDQEFFSVIDPSIMGGTTAARKERIREGISTGASWSKQYTSEVREKAELGAYFTRCQQFPLTAKGRLKTQALFTSRSLQLAHPHGNSGLIVTTSVLTDVPLKEFWEWLRDSGTIKLVLDCENSKGLFPAVHPSTKFSLLTLSSCGTREGSDHLSMGVYLTSQEELQDPDRRYSMPFSALTEINPLTRQLPICRSRRDFDLLLSLTRSAKPGLAVTPWVGFTSEGHSEHYASRHEPDHLPLIEGKMIHQFDSHFADYFSGEVADVSAERKGHPSVPRYWMNGETVREFLRRKGVHNTWTLAVRDYVRAVDSRTAIASAVPEAGLIQPLNGFSINGGPQEHAWALAVVNSFAYDFMAKQKTPGQHFNVTIMRQIPIVWDKRHEPFVTRRVLELAFTSPDLSGFARDLGDTGTHFQWVASRRERIRAELDAFLFHLHGRERNDVEYIMNSFRVVRETDERSHGTYRSKDLILAEYDRMAAAGLTLETPLDESESGTYRSTLTPPPGQGPRHLALQEG